MSGLGVDVVDVDRIRSALASDGLERRLFTLTERRYCAAKPDPAIHYAGTLAAKEAVIKALGLGPLVAWARCIEIERADDGAPVAYVQVGATKRIVPVSISHDGGVAVAIALPT